jgi:hypothetical protein
MKAGHVFRLFALVTLGAVGAEGCQKKIDKPPLEQDGHDGPGAVGGGSVVNPPVDGGLLVDGDAGLCTDLDIVAPLVDEDGLNGDFTGSGGTITDGTYDIVEAHVYLGPSGVGGPTSTTYQGAFRINGTSIEDAVITTAPGSPAAETTESGTLTPSGTDATAALVLTCPFAAAETVSYSSPGSGSLTLYFPARKVAFVLRLRA